MVPKCRLRRESHGIALHVVSQRDHVAVYVVRQFRQLGIPEPNHEIVATGFFALDALPQDTTRGTHARIREVVEGVAPSADWS